MSRYGKPSGVACACGCGLETTRYHSGRVSRYVGGHQGRERTAGYVIEERGHSTPCWVWQGRPNASGYGRIARGGPQGLAHRWHYEKYIGPVPEGLDLDHLCRVRLCVNPAHLEPVTNAENIRRGDGAILTREVVAAIKAELCVANEGRSRTPPGLYAELGERFGVTKWTIRGINLGERWVDV